MSSVETTDAQMRAPSVTAQWPLPYRWMVEGLAMGGIGFFLCALFNEVGVFGILLFGGLFQFLLGLLTLPWLGVRWLLHRMGMKSTTRPLRVASIRTTVVIAVFYSISAFFAYGAEFYMWGGHQGPDYHQAAIYRGPGWLASFISMGLGEGLRMLQGSGPWVSRWRTIAWRTHQLAAGLAFAFMADC